MRHRLCLVLLLAGTCAAGADQTSTLTFDDAGALADWTFHNGPEFPGAKGEINWRSDAGHDRPGCLALRHDFTAGGNYVQAVCPAPAGSDPGAVRLWLKKPRDHRIAFRATDSANQTFQKYLNYTCNRWQQIEVNLTRWDSFFGGPADGVVRYPIKRLGIMIENTAEMKTGELLIDDLAWLPRSAEAAPAVPPDLRGQRFYRPAALVPGRRGRQPARKRHLELCLQPRHRTFAEHELLVAGFPVYVQGDKGFTFKPIGWIEPLKLTDSHLHPGEQTTIHVEPDAKVHDWIVPPGWNTPQPRPDGTRGVTNDQAKNS